MADSGHPPAELHERLLICRTIKLNAGAHGGHRRCCHAQMQKNAQNKPQIARLILCVHTTLQVYCNLFLTFCKIIIFYEWCRPNEITGIRYKPDTRYFFPSRKAIDLFTAFRYNFLKSILSHPFRDFFKKSQKSLEALEQFSRSHAIYSRGLNTEVIEGDADGQADRPKRFSCGAAR